MILIPESTAELVRLKDAHVDKYGTCPFYLDADSAVQAGAVTKTTLTKTVPVVTKKAQPGKAKKPRKPRKQKKSARLLPWTDSDESNPESDDDAEDDDKENSSEAPPKKKPPKKLTTPQDHATKGMAKDFLPLPISTSRRKQATPQKTTPKKTTPDPTKVSEMGSTSTVLREALGTLSPPQGMILR